MKNTHVSPHLFLDLATIYPTFLESKIILVLETRMRFSLGGLQALGLIETDPPQTADGNLSAPQAKLTGQALYLMASMMGDSDMDLTNGIDAIN